MNPIDVYRVLLGLKKATHLHHANSVKTSCTFLEQGALLSRSFVETHKLEQTSQTSDGIDKKYDIWHCVFLDHVDIHDRASRPNYYGPVLFVLDLDVLNHLPKGSKVFVTKKNPVNWKDSDTSDDRWFQSPEELEASISFGDFDKMLVIETPEEKLDFPRRQVKIILDDPNRDTSSAGRAYEHAESLLKEAAAAGGIKLVVKKRQCYFCRCVQKYAAYNARRFDLNFT